LGGSLLPLFAVWQCAFDMGLVLIVCVVAGGGSWLCYARTLGYYSQVCYVVSLWALCDAGLAVIDLVPSAYVPAGDPYLVWGLFGVFHPGNFRWFLENSWMGAPNKGSPMCNLLIVYEKTAWQIFGTVRASP